VAEILRARERRERKALAAAQQAQVEADAAAAAAALAREPEPPSVEGMRPVTAILYDVESSPDVGTPYAERSATASYDPNRNGNGAGNGALIEHVDLREGAHVPSAAAADPAATDGGWR
jgi:hypothetical protein